MRRSGRSLAVVLHFSLALGMLGAATGVAVAADAEKYSFEYRFTPGETLRTKVVHQAQVRTTVDGSSQTASTVSTSTKVWEVVEVDGTGQITFVHSVDHVNMKNEVTGRESVEFDTRDTEEPPPGFEHVAKRVGVPLTRIKMTKTGEIVEREELAPEDKSQPSQMVLPLPTRPIAVGEVWTNPYEFVIQLQDGTTKPIKTRQRFELKSVEHGVATIEVATQVLTPVDSPEVQAQLVQRESEGTIRFDLEAGRMLGQVIDLDRHVVGHPNPKSSMHYRTRFSEELIDEDAASTAEKDNGAGDGRTAAKADEDTSSN